MMSGDGGVLLHELFIRQAKATPDDVAVVEVSGHSLTFRELDNFTDVLASALQQNGVKPDTCVAIYMEKCIEYTIAYIGILKAGGAYLPIDLSYPVTLIASIFEDACPKAVITLPELAKTIPDGQATIVLDKDWVLRLSAEIQKGSDLVPTKPITWDNLAYIVYSSGTTGKPKGIKCPHRGAVLSYTWRHEAYPYAENEREACNIFFVWEMLRPLLKGVPLYIISDNIIYDPFLLNKFLRENKITRMLFTPSLLETILNTTELDLHSSLKTMRQIWFCGEVVTTSLLEKCIRMIPWVQLLNLYSISECHDAACEDLSAYYQLHQNDLTKRKFCPVGQLLPHVSVTIMNENLEPQPVGISGEICVGGLTLAKGYLNRPKLNAERFITMPSSMENTEGDVLYRTGDWGYMLSDGHLEICGRCDSMVKIRGYSIEIQAIKSSLMSLPMVHSCVVLVKGEEGKDKFMVAYIIPEGETTKREIRSMLKKRLPFYMIPSYFIFIDSIPVLQASGKLDIAALPPFNQLENNVDIDSQPKTATEKELAALWVEVLHLQEIDVQESFFDVGGHSLLAALLLNKVNSRFKVKLSVKDMFLFPTVAQQSRLIEEKLHILPDDCSIRPIIQDLNLIDEVNCHDQGIVNIDMSLRAFWRSFVYGNRWYKGRVLLTGATGFLGAFLIQELLLQTKTFIYCLVRELPGVSTRDRIHTTLEKYGIIASDSKRESEKQKTVQKLLETRLTTVKGDVAVVNLGMNEEDHYHMCTEIDFIIHAAASVNLAYPYIALQAPNVLGTENVILFAHTSKIKPLHYISTDAVFPHGLQNCSDDDDASQYHAQLTDGYAQSKWVAEQLVQRARQRGLPVVVYRLGNLSGDQDNACWNPQDFTLLIIQACAKSGLAPLVDWHMEMTPVNFVASLVVKLTQNLTQAVGKIFHIINTKPINARWMFEWMNVHGYPLKMIPFEEWRQRMYDQDENADKNGFLHRLLDSYMRDPSFFSDLTVYKNPVTQKVLQILGLSYPNIDAALLKVYFDKLGRQKIIPRARRMSAFDKILCGKVAIVTGASSGIGTAIVEALVKAGAMVAMASRREDRMQELREKLTEDGGTVISIKTDVTNREEVKELVHHAECTLGPVDILVNCAGVMYYSLMKNLNEDEWHRQIDVNCKGVMNCIGAVLDGMVKRKNGHIVNISSDAGRRGFAGLSVYSGTKFFIEGMSQGLRLEVKEIGIRVTCIQPGDVKTELLSHTTDREALDLYDASSSHKILESEDIAKAVVYAVIQPEHVAVNEILIEPRAAPI